MDKNKGKGAANLRRINTVKKQEKYWEKVHAEIKKLGLTVNFNPTPTYVHIAKEIE